MGRLHFIDPNPTGAPAVLLLHGLGANGSSWALQIPPLTETGFRPIAPDVSGFGESHYDGHGWNFKRAAGELSALLDELQTGPVHIVGLSMGGVIAQQLAFDEPERIRKLVLASTFAALRPAHWTGWGYFLRRVILVWGLGAQGQAHFVGERLFPEPNQEPLRQIFLEQIEQADPRAYRAAMRSIGLFDSRRRLKQIKAPTLVITGSNDGTVSPHIQTILADGIPGARHVIIAGARHAVSVDHAEEFNREMLSFLRET